MFNRYAIASPAQSPYYVKEATVDACHTKKLRQQYLNHTLADCWQWFIKDAVATVKQWRKQQLDGKFYAVVVVVEVARVDHGDYKPLSLWLLCVDRRLIWQQKKSTNPPTDGAHCNSYPSHNNGHLCTLCITTNRCDWHAVPCIAFYETKRDDSSSFTQ